MALPELAEIRAPHGGARPMSAAQLVGEGRRAVVRALRRRLAELDTSAFENLCSSLLDKMGMRDVRVAKRREGGLVYLARQRRGVSDLRVAVKLVRGGREISRGDVQELRKDLAHYSAQMGIVLAPGEAGRDARGEASAAGQAPVALYCGEALPEEMIALRVGVTVQTVEVPDMDEAFFAGLGRHRAEEPALPATGGARRAQYPTEEPALPATGGARRAQYPTEEPALPATGGARRAQYPTEEPALPATGGARRAQYPTEEPAMPATGGARRAQYPTEEPAMPATGGARRAQYPTEEPAMPATGGARRAQYPEERPRREREEEPQ